MRKLTLLVMLAVAALKAQSDFPGPVTVFPDQANNNDACLRLVSLATSQMVVACAPASLSSTYTIRFPGSNSSGVLTNDGSGNLSWGASAGAPFTDASALVKNDSDPTKLAIISAASITTGTTRTYTLPDVSMILAGRNADNSFSVTQTFSGRINIGTSGASGPGIRDNAGVLECSDDGSTWLACGPSSVTNYWNRTGTTITTATAGDVLKLDSHLLFSAPSAGDIGDATNYGQTLYVENVNAAPSGVTGNYMKGRKLEVVDDAGGTGFWDIQSKANATNSTLYIRDAGGTNVIDFHRIDATAAVDYANVYVDLYPDSGGSQKLGKSGQHWGQLWATDTYSNYLHAITGTVVGLYADLVPITNNTYDLGATAARVKKLWVVDIDCSGTCPGGSNYWTRTGTVLSTTTANDDVEIDGLLTLGNHLLFGAPSVSDIGSATNYFQTAYGENANFAPSGVTANYTKIRKLEVVDDAGGTSFWDFQSKANATNSTLYLRDAAGGLVVDFHRIDSTAAVDYANFYVDLYPDSGGSQKLGKSGQQWGQMWATDSYTNYLHQISGSYIYSYAHFAPIANATYDLGDDSTPLRWRNFAFTGAIVQSGTTRLDASGNLTVTSCTGCGAASLPVTDTTGISKGSSDATKIVRFEVDGFTTATTRVLTPPNADITIAGINHAQTWTATQTFGGSSSIDTSGNFSAVSFRIGGTTVIDSSRFWSTSAGSFSPSSAAGASLGTPANYWAGLYLSEDIVQDAVIRLSGVGVFNGASYNVAGTEVISSGRVGKFVSLDINGTSNVIDSSRNASVVSITVNGSYGINSSGTGTFGTVGLTSLTQGFSTRIDSSGNGSFVALTASGNLTWSGQTRGPYTADTGLSFASSAGKIAYYDTGGNFKGWIPVLP